jgi:hypothetical protein
LPNDYRNQQDKRRVAVHEAGHIIVAAHFGRQPWAILHYADRREGSCWAGRTFYLAEGKGDSVIGVAGLVAEARYHKGIENTEAIETEVWLRLNKQPGTVSGTDRAAIRMDYRYLSDVGQALRILGEHEALFHVVVDRLISSGILLGDEFEELNEQHRRHRERQHA